MQMDKDVVEDRGAKFGADVLLGVVKTAAGCNGSEGLDICKVGKLWV